ncbi:AbrB family transcriptional regulator [Saccharomonospora sp. CUA-673]|uniref:AbrB family transcriptional regulator n=1 Tax=Saccharomonospora sp. CUA-673 TaxID=1904969 RepID=UPI003519342D
MSCDSSCASSGRASGGDHGPRGRSVLRWGFAAWGLMEPGESMFALLPGGVGEMVATAVSLGFDGAVVTGAHMVRLFTVVLSLPLIFWAAEAIHRRWIAGGRDGQAE